MDRMSSPHSLSQVSVKIPIENSEFPCVIVTIDPRLSEFLSGQIMGRGTSSDLDLGFRSDNTSQMPRIKLKYPRQATIKNCGTSLETVREISRFAINTFDGLVATAEFTYAKVFSIPRLFTKSDDKCPNFQPGPLPLGTQIWVELSGLKDTDQKIQDYTKLATEMQRKVEESKWDIVAQDRPFWNETMLESLSNLFLRKSIEHKDEEKLSSNLKKFSYYINYIQLVLQEYRKLAATDAAFGEGNSLLILEQNVGLFQKIYHSQVLDPMKRFVLDRKALLSSKNKLDDLSSLIKVAENLLKLSFFSLSYKKPKSAIQLAYHDYLFDRWETPIGFLSNVSIKEQCIPSFLSERVHTKALVANEFFDILCEMATEDTDRHEFVKIRNFYSQVMSFVNQKNPSQAFFSLTLILSLSNSSLEKVQNNFVDGIFRVHFSNFKTFLKNVAEEFLRWQKPSPEALAALRSLRNFSMASEIKSESQGIFPDDLADTIEKIRSEIDLTHEQVRAGLSDVEESMIPFLAALDQGNKNIGDRYEDLMDAILASYIVLLEKIMFFHSNSKKLSLEIENIDDKEEKQKLCASCKIVADEIDTAFDPFISFLDNFSSLFDLDKGRKGDFLPFFQHSHLGASFENPIICFLEEIERSTIDPLTNAVDPVLETKKAII